MGRTFFLHLLYWVTYVTLNGVMVSIRRDVFDINSFWAEFFSLPSKIAFTYYVIYVVAPYFFSKGKLSGTVLLTMVGLIITVVWYRFVLIEYIFPTYFKKNDGEYWNELGLIQTLFDIFVTTVPVLAIKLVRMHIRTLKNEKALREEKLENELKWLRAQVNPHFLFNTLTNIYMLAKKKATETPKAILDLAKIYRFVLDEGRNSRIPIQNEADIIHHFIELEKLGYSDRLKVSYHSEMDDPMRQIAPLLLLPFVENAFKHGASESIHQAFIDIKLFLKDGKIRFDVKNSTEPLQSGENSGILTQIHQGREKKSGIGLQNVKRQLELVYPDTHTLKTGFLPDSTVYSVVLEVKIND